MTGPSRVAGIPHGAAIAPTELPGAGKSVLVTGASGFVGRNLIPFLLSQGWRVVAASRSQHAVSSGSLASPAALFDPDQLRHVELPDLRDPIDWERLIEGCSHVVHLAGVAHATSSIGEEIYDQVNAERVGELAQACARGGTRLVFLSSIRALVGANATGIIVDGSEAQPSDAYGRSKRRAEILLETSEADFCTLRPVLIYGPGVKGNMASLLRLSKSRLPLPFGALRVRRSVLGIDNLNAAIAHVLDNDRVLRRTLIVADTEAPTVGEIIAALRAGLGRDPGLVSVPAKLLGGTLRVLGRGAMAERLLHALEVDASGLRNTGWEPVHSSKAGLATMAAASLPGRECERPG